MVYTVFTGQNGYFVAKSNFSAMLYANRRRRPVYTGSKARQPNMVLGKISTICGKITRISKHKIMANQKGKTP